MKKTNKKVLVFVFRMVDIICWIGISSFVIFGILEEIVGYRNMVDLLENFIPFNYNFFFFMSLVCIVILILSKYVQRKNNM